MTIVLLDQTESTPTKAHISPWASVAWRTIVAAVLVVAAFLGLVWVVAATRRIIAWVIIAGFFAIVLAPSVRRVQRLVGDRRVVATAIVTFLATFAFVGMIAVFVMPIRTQLVHAVSDLPGTVESAANGTGPVGRIVSRLNLDNVVRDHRVELRRWAANVSKSSVDIARTAITYLLAVVTIFVTTFLFLTQSATMGKALLPVVPARRRAAAKRVCVDAASAVSGYMIGNLLISLVAGTAAFVCLLALGVPNPALFALWVAFADLIPLVGATLGAVVAVLAAFLHSTTAGVVALIFFVVYQQFENSVLQTAVMSRTVKVNPLVVLLSVLLGVELFGLTGSLLAIPLAGSLQVIVREIWSESRRDWLVLPDEIAAGANDEDERRA